MKKFAITVTETSSHTFTIEAPDKRSAEHLFNDWADRNSEEIAYRLNKNYDGWEYSDAEEVHEECWEDISFDDALAATKKNLERMIASRLDVAGMPVVGNSIMGMIDMVAKILMESDTFQNSYLFTYEDVDSAIKAIAQEMIDKLNGK